MRLFVGRGPGSHRAGDFLQVQGPDRARSRREEARLRAQSCGKLFRKNSSVARFTAPLCQRRTLRRWSPTCARLCRASCPRGPSSRERIWIREMRETSQRPPCIPRKLKPLEVPTEGLKNQWLFLLLHSETLQLPRRRIQHSPKPATDRLCERELGCLLRNLPQHQTARSLHKSYASLPLELHRENPAFSEEQSITPMLTGG